MEGHQKLFYLPYPFSDFIFAVAGEELGLLGASAIVGAFVLLLWRGVRAAWKAPDRFRHAARDGAHARDRDAGVREHQRGARPAAHEKGIPLPFISAGGSSLFLTLVAVGVILNVSQHGD
jgi:cell division protein FtsW